MTIIHEYSVADVPVKHASVRQRRKAIGFVLVAVGLFVVLFSVWNVTRASAVVWHPDGIAGVTIHSLVSGTGKQDLVFAGTEDGVYRRMGDGQWQRVLQVGTVWAVALEPDNRTVLAGDESGDVYVSPDRGAHWTHHLLSPDGVFALIAPSGNPHTILAGGGSGIYASQDGGQSWQRRLALRHSAGAAFAQVSAGSPLILAGAVSDGSLDADTGVYLSRDWGQTWQAWGRGLKSKAGIMSLAVLPGGHAFTGTMGNTIWQIGPAGGKWRHSDQGIPGDQHVAGITILGNHPAAIVLGTLGAGIFISKDGGNHWLSVSSGLPSFSGQHIVLSLNYDARDRTVYAGTASGVYGADATTLKGSSS